MDNPYTGEYEPFGVRAAFPGQVGLERYIACDAQIAGYRITGYGKDHLLITLESIANVPADVRYAHDIVMANVLLTMDAARRFAVANGGNYPQDLSEAGADGKTLVDLLPNGELLIHPVYGVLANPQDGAGLADYGSVGYIGLDLGGDGTISDFVIEGTDAVVSSS